MDHSEAIQLKAVERYALGDLSVSEVEEFERHFFDCVQCSEELGLLAIFQENARAVFAEPVFVKPMEIGQRVSAGATAAIQETRIPAQDRESFWTRIAAIWRQPWTVAPALGAVALAILVGYLGGLRRSEGPQSVAAFPLYAASRGDETVVAPAGGAKFYTLYMDRTWERDYPSYTASLREDPGGTVRYSLAIGELKPGQSIQVLVPAQSLTPGKYALTVSAPDGTELARYPFVLRFN